MQKRVYTLLYNIVSVVMTAAVAVSCATDTVYYSYAHTPVAGWEKNDTLTFNIPGMAAPGTYSQQVGLRMTSAFPFTSISLIVEQRIMPRGKVLTDTIKCPITDIRGNFLGDGISSFQYMFPLREVTQHEARDSARRFGHRTEDGIQMTKTSLFTASLCHVMEIK